MRPLIGVFTSERHAGLLGTLQRCDESAPAKELRLGLPYLRAIEAGGGLPVVLAPDDPELADALLDAARRPVPRGRAGPRPARLRSRPTATSGSARPTASSTPPSSRSRAPPTRAGCRSLGICRGLQALNVVRGGTLHQHVDDHRQATPRDRAVRTPWRSSRARLLAGLTGSSPLGVNSFHHQAARRLGDGVRVTRPRARRHGRGDRGSARARSGSASSGTPRG